MLKATFPDKSVGFYALAGPYLGFGLSGTSQNEFIVQFMILQSEESIHFGSDPDSDDLRRLDFGLTLGTGVQLESFRFEFTYGLGLSNLTVDPSRGSMQHSRCFAVSVAYGFPLKKQSTTQ